MIRLGEIVDIQSGLNTRSAVGGDGIPVLTMASLSDVHASGIGAESLLMVERDSGLLTSRYQVEPLDLLVPARTTPAHLNPVLLGEGFLDSLGFNSSILRLRVNRSSVDPWWLLGYLRSPDGMRQLLQGSQSTTGQLNLNAKMLAKLQLPDLPIDVQQRYGKLISLAHLVHEKAIGAANLRLELAHAVAFSSDL